MTIHDDLIAAARANHRGSLDELAGKQLLAGFGVQVPHSMMIDGPDAVASALRTLSLPVVVKVMSPDILHKSDAGGVKVNLKTADEVRQAIATMAAAPAMQSAHIDGYLIEEMAPPGQEIVIGSVNDPQFGPLVMVGLGGIFVEVLADVSFRICPITPLDAGEMLDELKGVAILDGVRGGKPVSRAAIIDALLRVGGEGGLLDRHAGDFSEVDINPLIVSATGAVAVDARFILSAHAAPQTP
jgi:succinyl-CoA synthetase beta subunit